MSEGVFEHTGPVSEEEYYALPPDGGRSELIDGVLIYSGPFTDEEYYALPEDGRRHELIDGALVMSPAPDRAHQRISSRLWLILDEAAPAALEAQEAINVRVAPRKLVIPDLVVVTSAGSDDHEVPAAEVVMMVEIVSSSTKRIDRVVKPSLAAEVGIPYYMLIEPGEPDVTISELDGEGYRAVTKAAGEEQFVIEKPFPVSFRPADLLATHR